MSIYVQTRDGCFPLLGWSTWKHIACGKLQLPEDLAWLYFETFDLLIGHSPEERLELAECFSQCSSTSDLDQQRNKVRKWQWFHLHLININQKYYIVPCLVRNFTLICVIVWFCSSHFSCRWTHYSSSCSFIFNN